MNNVSSCPDRTALERLAVGQASAAEVDRLAEHLDGCGACVQTLHTLRVSDTLLDAVRAQGRAVPRPGGELVETVMERLCRLPGEVAGSSGGPTAVDASPAQSSLDTPPPPGPSARRPEPTQEVYAFLAPPQRPGEIGRLGGYRVLQVLGQGGMGVVFAGEDVRLKRKVALKAMRPALAADEAARRRFLREAEATAAVHSDHVVTIHQVGEEGGVPFLAMEFLEGLPLDRWLQGGRQPSVPQVLRIGREIALGLAAAHEKGLIHRDIKPGNLWLEASHGGRVKILDFGLARAVRDDVHLTQSGAVVGTPTFMSPEQARGAPVDARTDLFSLGCVLYRLCAGRNPFRGDSTLAVLTALAVDNPVPVHEVNPAIPPALSQLVTQLLSKDPAGRPGSARAVAEALHAVERSLPGRGPAPAAVAADPTAPMTLVPPAAPPAAVPVALPVAIPFTAPPPARERRPHSRLRLAGAGVVLLALAGTAAYFLAAVVLRVPTDNGELVIQADDHDIEVTVTPGQPDVLVVDRRTKRQLSLRPGDYEIQVKEKDGLQFATRKVTLTRGGREVLRAELVLAKSAPPGAPGLTPAPGSPAPPEGLPVEAVLGDGRLRHWNRITGVAVSPDGKWIASVSADTTARFWDAATGRERVALKPAKDQLLCVAFHPRGRLLATGGMDAALTVHDLETGESRVAAEMGGWVHMVAFSPDGRSLAAMTRSSLRVLDPDTGNEVFVRHWPAEGNDALGATDTGSGGLAFSPDDRTLAYRAGGDRVQLLDAATGKDRDVFHVAGKEVASLAWSPDGKTLAVGTTHPRAAVTLLDARTGKEQKTFKHAEPEEDPVWLAFSPDGRTLATVFGLRKYAINILGGRVRQWDLASGKEGPMLLARVPNTGFGAAAFTPDGRALITGGQDHVVRRWDAATGAERPALDGAADFVWALALSPDGRTIACGGNDGTIKLIDPATKAVRRTLHGHQGVISGLAFSGDGKALASAASDQTARVWDVDTGKERLSVPCNADRVAFRPDGKMFANEWWGPGGAVKVWDARTGAEGPKLEQAGASATACLAFSPDNHTLAVSYMDHPVVLWDLDTDKKRRELASAQERLDFTFSTAYSPDGRTLAAAYLVPNVCPVKLWDVATGEPRLSLSYGWLVDAMAFSPDGKVLVTGGNDEATVRFWDTATGRPLRTWTIGPAQGRVRGLAVTPDGRHLLTLNGNGTVYLLRMDWLPGHGQAPAAHP
jgi:WD40 repeat protein/tRNA A-37 threonylcarbamoyl transferase component Bud32